MERRTERAPLNARRISTRSFLYEEFVEGVIHLLDMVQRLFDEGGQFIGKGAEAAGTKNTVYGDQNSTEALVAADVLVSLRISRSFHHAVLEPEMAILDKLEFQKVAPRGLDVAAIDGFQNTRSHLMHALMIVGKRVYHFRDGHRVVHVTLPKRYQLYHQFPPLKRKTGTLGKSWSAAETDST